MATTKQIAKGSRSAIAWCPEESYGVLPAATGWTFRGLNNEALGEAIETVTAEDIRSNRTTPGVRGGNISASGSITHDFDAVTPLPWFRHLLGGSTALAASAYSPSALAVGTYKRGECFTALSKTFMVLRGGTLAAGVVAGDLTNYTTTGATAELAAAIGSPIRVECIGTSSLSLYSYAISGADALPPGGLAIEKQILGAEDPLYVQFLGCRLNTLELSVPQSTVCKASWGVVGLTVEAPISAAATGTVTVTTPADNDTVVIDGKTYTFKTTLGVTANQVKIGVDATATAANLTAAIMLHSGAGSTYAAATTLHPSVYATSALGVTTLTAKVGGTAGNSITLTKVGTNITVSAATLTGGTSGKKSGTVDGTFVRQPVTGLNAFVDVGDAAYVGKTDNLLAWRDASISISNGIDENVYVIGSRYRADVPEGVRSISGRLSCYYTDRSTYDLFKNETKVPIAISFAYNGEFLRIEIPEVKLTGDGQPKIAGPGVMTQDFTFTAFLDEGNNAISGATDIRVYAINKAASMVS